MIKAEYSSFFGRAVVCASLAISIFTSAQAEDSWKKVTIQEFATIETGGTVRVDNPHGNIYARFGGYENEVEVLATIQQLDGDLPGLKLDISPAEGGLDISVKPAKSDAGETSDRIDLVVFVPKGATLDART